MTWRRPTLCESWMGSTASAEYAADINFTAVTKPETLPEDAVEPVISDQPEQSETSQDSAKSAADTVADDTPMPASLPEPVAQEDLLGSSRWILPGNVREAILTASLPIQLVSNASGSLVATSGHCRTSA